jgi:hypothetical protein
MVLEEYNSLGMGLRIFLRQIDFEDFHMVAARNIILVKKNSGCFIHDNGDLYSRQPSNIEAVRLLFLDKLVLVFFADID